MIRTDDLNIGGARPVRIITLDAPGKANALTLHMMDELRRELYQSGDRSVILTGAGQAFCGGLDLDEIAAAKSVKSHLDAFTEVFAVWATRPAPVISLINGPAAAGGVGLAVCADICIA